MRIFEASARAVDGVRPLILSNQGEAGARHGDAHLAGLVVAEGSFLCRQRVTFFGDPRLLLRRPRWDKLLNSW